MRLAVLLLVLLNLGLFTYFNVADLFSTNQVVKNEPISPEKIVLLSDAAIQKLPKKTLETNNLTLLPRNNANSSCFEWGSFSKTNLLVAQAALAKLSVMSSVKLQSPHEALRYWVYIPRLKSHAAVEAKVNELKALGFVDVSVVQEPKWKDAISLGVFSDEKLATQHLDDLKSKGILNATKRLRNEEQGYASLVLSPINAGLAAQLSSLIPDFPGSELKKIECNAL